jgi:hypothetical protein
VRKENYRRLQDLAYNFFADNDLCLIWSQLSKIRTPPIVTTDFLYVRFIGDRSIDEKDFGKIQKDRVSEMSNCKLEVPTGVNQNPYASTKFPEPDLKKKKTEIKGGLAELQKRGIRITSYTESKG